MCQTPYINYSFKALPKINHILCWLGSFNSGVICHRYQIYSCY